MNKKTVALFMVGLLVVWFAVPASAVPGAAGQKKDEKPAPAKVYIPKDVKEPIMAGLAAKKPRLDIPFEVFKTYYLPAQSYLFHVFFLKIKNSDLGFVPVIASQVADPAAPPVTKMKTMFNVYLQFNKAENGAATQLIKEVFVPVSIEVDQNAFDPNKEEWYTVGYPLPPGNYLAAIALTSPDNKKIGIQYNEFVLPDPRPAAALEPTPLMFFQEFKDVPTIETMTELHKGSIRYSRFQLVPYVDNVYSPGQNITFFTFIFGAKPDEAKKFDIEISFEVVQGDKPAMKFNPQKFASPAIQQDFQLSQKLQIKKGDEVKTETRNLPAGNYTLVAKITDKVSGLKTEKKIDFVVK